MTVAGLLLLTVAGLLPVTRLLLPVAGLLLPATRLLLSVTGLLPVARLLLLATGLLPVARLLLLATGLLPVAGLLRRFLDFAQNFFYSIPQLTHNKVDSVQPFFMCRGKYMLSSNLIDCVVSRFVFAHERAEVNGVGFQRGQQ